MSASSSTISVDKKGKNENDTQDDEERVHPVTYSEYTCYDCNSIVRLTPNCIIRCPECGYRIVYKIRNRSSQYLAR